MQRGIQIQISFSSDTSAMQVVNEAREMEVQAKRDKNPFETIWLFFDHDNQPKLADVFTKIDKWGYFVAYSSICFEHWFLLFFEDNRRAHRNAVEVINYLKQKHWPDYHKTKINHYEYLKDKLPQAKERARFIKQQVDDTLPIYQCNPYFTVNELITFFEKLQDD